MSPRKSSLSLNQKLTLLISFFAILGAIVAAFVSGHDWFSSTPSLAEPNTATPAPTQTQFMAPTFTVTPTIPTAAITPELTSTLTDTPTAANPPAEIPVLLKPSLLRQDCFDINIWTPYERHQTLSKDRGCWNLNPWGFTARNNEIIIVSPNSSRGEFHGIYAPIANQSEISFKIRVDKFDVDPGVTANIGIGIINLDPLGPAASRLVFYHYIPAKSELYIPLKTGVDAEYKDLIPTTLKFSIPQKVVLKVDGPFLTMIFDDTTEVKLTIPFEKRAFWISYSIPPSTELIMSIFDLQIR